MSNINSIYVIDDNIDIAAMCVIDETLSLLYLC